MKLLFQNYSNRNMTEPAYLCNALNQCGIESLLWANPQVSAFDMLDSVNPDVFVTHFETMNSDILTYISQAKDLKTIINVTGASEMQYNDIKKVAEDCNVPFLFTNSVKIPSYMDAKQLYPAADVFAPSPPSFQESYPLAMLVDKMSENIEKQVEKNGLYHLLYVGREEKQGPFDVSVSAQDLYGIYPLYDECRLVGSNDFCFSQIFFDANLRCKKVSLVPEDPVSFYGNLSKIFKVSDSLKEGDVSDDAIGKEIRQQVRTRHTPYHRAATLMKHLKDKESLEKVEAMKSKILGGLV